jgi:hypothetical protein
MQMSQLIPDIKNEGISYLIECAKRISGIIFIRCPEDPKIGKLKQLKSTYFQNDLDFLFPQLINKMKYNTLGTFPTFNRKIVERDKYQHTNP